MMEHHKMGRGHCKKVREHCKKGLVLHMKGRNMLELEERHTRHLVHYSLNQERCIQNLGHSNSHRSNPRPWASCGVSFVHHHYLYSCYAVGCVCVFGAGVFV